MSTLACLIFVAAAVLNMRDGDSDAATMTVGVSL